MAKEILGKIIQEKYRKFKRGKKQILRGEKKNQTKLKTITREEISREKKNYSFLFFPPTIHLSMKYRAKKNKYTGENKKGV